MSGLNNDILLMDLDVFDQRRRGMLTSVGALNFDTSSFSMENTVCGTETMSELISQWNSVAKVSVDFSGLYTNSIDPSLSTTSNSMQQVDLLSANALNCGIGSSAGISSFLSCNSSGFSSGIMSMFSTTLNSDWLQRVLYYKWRKEFMEKRNIDEETMARVEKDIEDYKNGDTSCMDKFNKFRNLSEEEFEQRVSAYSEEFTEFVALSLFTGEMVEKGEGNLDDVGVYQSIQKDIIGKMYSVKRKNVGPEWSSATLDNQLLLNMKGAYKALNAEDSLANNILTKLEGDTTKYRVTDNKIGVEFTREERGFLSITISDTYSDTQDTEPQHRQFLATSQDNAKEYIKKLRGSASNCSNHSLSDDELGGMFQSVVNLDDLHIMENIVIADNNFMIGDKNALDIDYWNSESDGGVHHYKEGMSDSYSVALGTMGAIMLERGNQLGYGQFMRAALDANVSNKDHNILVDIGSGAGMYFSECLKEVGGDELGEGDDAMLHMRYNAALANYAGFTSLCNQTESIYKADKSDVELVSFLYSPNLAYVKAEFKLDTEPLFLIFGGEKDKTFNVEAEVTDDMSRVQVSEKGKLNAELKRKQQEMIYDCVTDTIGCIHPAYRFGLKLAKSAGKGKPSAGTDTASLVLQGMKETDIDLKSISRGWFENIDSKDAFAGANGVVTILSYGIKYHETMEQYTKDMKDADEVQAFSNGMLSYNTGLGEFGDYDYYNIRRRQMWNNEGIVAIVGPDHSNEEIYSALHDDKGAYKQLFMRRVVHSVTGVESNNGSMDEYKKEEIDNAVRVVIFGGNNENHIHEDDKYKSISDIPLDLLNAVIYGMSERDSVPDSCDIGTGINVGESWKGVEVHDN